MDFKKSYGKSWEYICSSKKYIFFIIGVFIIFGVLGFVFSSNLNFLMDILKDMVDSTEGLNTVQLIVYIFFNNLRASLFGMLSGIFFGIFPFITAVGNGTVLGFVFEKVSAKLGALELWKIFPHGIFELPAVFISLGIGVRLGMFVLAKNREKAFISEVRNALMTFALIIIPLLFIAAIIEGVLIGVLK